MLIPAPDPSSYTRRVLTHNSGCRSLPDPDEAGRVIFEIWSLTEDLKYDRVIGWNSLTAWQALQFAGQIVRSAIRAELRRLRPLTTPRITRGPSQPNGTRMS